MAHAAGAGQERENSHRTLFTWESNLVIDDPLDVLEQLLLHIFSRGKDRRLRTRSCPRWHTAGNYF